MEGLVDLGINPSVFVAQVINFVVLFVILYLVAYKPIMRMLDERSRKIEQSIEQAESIEKQAIHAEEEVKKQLEMAGREGQERITRALRAGEEIKQKAQQEARQEVENIIVRSRTDIQRERDEAIAGLRREFAGLTILAAGKVIDRSLDKETHHQIIGEVLEESLALKKK